MAGGIDWFRWHHGSVTDPKFQLVARKAGASLPEVLSVWAFVLEQASASEDRGSFSEIDAEAVDCLFGMDDGLTAAILDQMAVRGLLVDGAVANWQKRQPKRERESDGSTDRVRAYRERQRQQQPDFATDEHETPCNATERQETPRGEERRVEIEDMAKTAATVLPVDSCPHLAIIDLYHQLCPFGSQIREWTPARQQLLRTRWREKAQRQNLDWWQRFFEYVAGSDFLSGKATTPGRKPFQLGLEWLLKSENFVKVIEGKYENERAAA